MKRLLFILLLIPSLISGQTFIDLSPDSTIDRLYIMQSVPGFCDEYQTLYDYLTTPPSGTVAENQNILVDSLVTYDVWSELDVFYCFAQTVNTDNEALINWITPGSYTATLHNSPTFTSLEGITGNGSDAYANCNWKPTDGVNYTQNDAMFGVYIRSDIVEDKADCGTTGGGYISQLLSARTARNCRIYINSGDMNQSANTDSKGLFLVNRDASNNADGYKNGILIVDGSAVSNGLSDWSIFVLGNNNLGSVNNACTRQISFFFAGGSLTPVKIKVLTNAIEAYMDSNGKGVVESFPIILICIIIPRKRNNNEKTINNFIDCSPIAA